MFFFLKVCFQIYKVEIDTIFSAIFFVEIPILPKRRYKIRYKNQKNNLIRDVFSKKVAKMQKKRPKASFFCSVKGHKPLYWLSYHCAERELVLAADPL